jgi:hypothetical protein
MKFDILDFAEEFVAMDGPSQGMIPSLLSPPQFSKVTHSEGLRLTARSNH